MPARADIAPSDLKSQLPHILLADVIENGRDFRYRLVGVQLAKFFHANPTGLLISEAIASFGKETLQATLVSYRRVVERKSPVRLTGVGSVFGQDPKHFDAFLAPLSNDGTNVNMILGTFAFLWDLTHPFRPPVKPSHTARPKSP